jgi:hypothetical protein
VDVQVHISDSGGGQFNIVGLADKAVAESRERVCAALSAIGLGDAFEGTGSFTTGSSSKGNGLSRRLGKYRFLDNPLGRHFPK